MNQILSTADGKSHGPLPIKSVIKFFAFSIIILGLILTRRRCLFFVLKL